MIAICLNKRDVQMCALNFMWKMSNIYVNMRHAFGDFLGNILGALQHGLLKDLVTA